MKPYLSFCTQYSQSDKTVSKYLWLLILNVIQTACLYLKCPWTENVTWRQYGSPKLSPEPLSAPSNCIRAAFHCQRPIDVGIPADSVTERDFCLSASFHLCCTHARTHTHLSLKLYNLGNWQRWVKGTDRRTDIQLSLRRWDLLIPHLIDTCHFSVVLQHVPV
jgi:hypothetical protein